MGYRLARGVFWSMAGAVISRGLMLAAWVLVARMLGKTGYGELGMIQSTVGMFGVFAGFGLGLSATKHVAEFRRCELPGLDSFYSRMLHIPCGWWVKDEDRSQIVDVIRQELM